MEANSKTAPPDFPVRIREEEVGRIFNLKESLDLSGVQVRYAARYQRLGWSLVALKADTAQDLRVDFAAPQEIWSKHLAELSLREGQVNLGVRTGQPSRLLVLEVKRQGGELILDQGGDWQAACVALMGQDREQHYYTWPEGWPPPASCTVAEAQVKVFGEGGLVVTPPSQEPGAQEAWRWLRPPWEQPPGHPSPEVWQFLKEHAPDLAAAPEAGLPSWDEVYRRISPCPTVLQALLAPAPSPEEYYYGLLQAAGAAGLRDQTLLLALLWHAPQGDARQRPQGRQYLQGLLARAQRQREEETRQRPGNFENPPESHRRPEPDAGAPYLSAPALSPGVPPGPPKPEPPPQPLGQLFTYLGERLLAEHGRHEAMLFEMGKLAARTAALEHQVGHREGPPSLWEPFPAGRKGPSPGLAGLAEQWTSPLPTPDQQKQQLLRDREAVQEFLEHNPDLAADRRKMDMVNYCLRYYVNINKEFGSLPLKERLTKAGRLARNFLKA